MRFVLLRVSKGGAPWADDAVATWIARIKRWSSFEEVVLRPELFRGDVDAVRRAEGERIQRALRDRDRLIVVDERGAVPTSDAFRAALVEAGHEVAGRVVFAIGGPYGHDEALRRRAHQVLGLSPLILNHEVARVVLVEQVYRALATHHGAPYGH